MPLFQSESKCETILMKMTDLQENETACTNSLSYERFRFETEAQENSEMAYCTRCLDKPQNP